MAKGFEIEIPPDQQQLFRALSECGLNIFSALQALKRLTGPPESLLSPSSDRISLMNSVIEELVEFDHELAAQTLRPSERRNPKKTTTWTELTPAERKRAKRNWAWALDSGLKSAPQGRPSVIDSALVLYCSRVIAEVCERRFSFSRPMGGGVPKGPLWRTLIAALPLAEAFLVRIDGAVTPRPRKMVSYAETIADILTSARSKKFSEYCKKANLGTRSSDIAERPAMFRLAISHARQSRERKQHAKPRVP